MTQQLNTAKGSWELASPQFSVLAPSDNSPLLTACLPAGLVCVSSREPKTTGISLKSVGRKLRKLESIEKQNHKISETVGSQQPFVCQ